MSDATHVMRPLWGSLFAAFAALNVWALASSGFEGVASYFRTMGPIDLVAAVDLVLALIIGMVLVVRNAAERSLRAREFVILTVFTGRIALLAYLARHGVGDPSQTSPTRPAA